MAEDTDILTDLNHSFDERQAGFRETEEAVGDRPELTVEQILAWADAHHTAHGAWPDVRLLAGLGPVDGVPGESWKAINFALAMGQRGLPGDSSLAELLAEHRGMPVPDMGPRALADKIWAWEQEQFPVKGPRCRLGGQQYSAPLSTTGILAWADAHRAATGAFPTAHSGPVRGAPYDVTWATVNSALSAGRRGFPGGSSLLRVLAEHRPTEFREPGRQVTQVQRLGHHKLPGGPGAPRVPVAYRSAPAQPTPDPLTIDEILGWAHAHHAATGAWPTYTSGPVPDAPGELTWDAINLSLILGSRGLPGGSSLSRLQAEHPTPRAPLTIEQILAWADAHHAAKGSWPVLSSGDVLGASDDTWRAIDTDLKKGGRSLPGGSSLGRMLAEHRGVGKVVSKRTLSVEQILAWADTFHATHGVWPKAGSGPVDGAPGETWKGIDSALGRGGRGLDRKTTLGRLIVEHRGSEAHNRAPTLTVEQVLAWAEAHFAAHGRWPSAESGRVGAAPHKTWGGINSALHSGHGGLPGGTSLARILEQHRGKAKKSSGPCLTIDQILTWADAHFAAHGRWPTLASGPVAASPYVTWGVIDWALSKGRRGLPGGTTIARLLDQHRGRLKTSALPPLSLDQILAWADAHFAAHGRWPTCKFGPVADAPDVTWGSIDSALVKGRRGFSGGTSLARVLAAHKLSRASAGGQSASLESK